MYLCEFERACGLIEQVLAKLALYLLAASTWPLMKAAAIQGLWAGEKVDKFPQNEPFIDILTFLFALTDWLKNLFNVMYAEVIYPLFI